MEVLSLEDIKADYILAQQILGQQGQKPQGLNYLVDFNWIETLQTYFSQLENLLMTEREYFSEKDVRAIQPVDNFALVNLSENFSNLYQQLNISQLRDTNSLFKDWNKMSLSASINVNSIFYCVPFDLWHKALQRFGGGPTVCLFRKEDGDLDFYPSTINIDNQCEGGNQFCTIISQYAPHYLVESHINWMANTQYLKTKIYLFDMQSQAFSEFNQELSQVKNGAYLIISDREPQVPQFFLALTFEQPMEDIPMEEVPMFSIQKGSKRQNEVQFNDQLINKNDYIFQGNDLSEFANDPEMLLAIKESLGLVDCHPDNQQSFQQLPQLRDASFTPNFDPQDMADDIPAQNTPSTGKLSNKNFVSEEGSFNQDREKVDELIHQLNIEVNKSKGIHNREGDVLRNQADQKFKEDFKQIRDQKADVFQANKIRAQLAIKEPKYNIGIKNWQQFRDSISKLQELVGKVDESMQS